MDLLGRKAKARYEAEFAYSNSLTDKFLKAIEQRNEALQVARTQGDALADLSNRLLSRESLLKDLLVEVEELKATNKQLLETMSKMVTVPPPSKTPLHVSEEEQEAKWQLDNKLIDAKEYEHLLKELDFQNSSIELDPDFEPRPGLTY